MAVDGGDDQDDATVNEDWPPSASAPFSRIPSNQEWAETKAWTRQFMANRRDLRRLAQREWLEGVRRRLGLVTEVHRCQVSRFWWRQGWDWICQRPGCDADGVFRPSQADAYAEALAHARSFVPEPPEEEPLGDLYDWVAYKTLADTVEWVPGGE